jgi:branched-chain amino acid transport system ATP-binding protein
VNSGPVLTVEGLTVRHGAITAVENASLEVRSGEITALLGPNGAGKSSLLRGIIGLAATEGRIVLDGVDIAVRAPEARAAAGLAWVPEGRRVFAGMTVADNLLVACSAGARERRRRLADVFDLFPQLAARPDARAWSLSGGQQQMLAIGRALMARPRAHLLDEPTLGLAPAVVADVAAALRAIAETGAAVLVAEQNAAFVDRVADRTIAIRNGRIG